jgi:hypothetical protein
MILSLAMLNFTKSLLFIIFKNLPYNCVESTRLILEKRPWDWIPELQNAFFPISQNAFFGQTIESLKRG